MIHTIRKAFNFRKVFSFSIALTFMFNAFSLTQTNAENFKFNISISKQDSEKPNSAIEFRIEKENSLNELRFSINGSGDFGIYDVIDVFKNGTRGRIDFLFSDDEANKISDKKYTLARFSNEDCCIIAAKIKDLLEKVLNSVEVVFVKQDYECCKHKLDEFKTEYSVEAVSEESKDISEIEKTPQTNEDISKNIGKLLDDKDDKSVLGIEETLQSRSISGSEEISQNIKDVSEDILDNKETLENSRISKLREILIDSKIVLKNEKMSLEDTPKSEEILQGDKISEFKEVFLSNERVSKIKEEFNKLIKDDDFLSEIEAELAKRELSTKGTLKNDDNAFPSGEVAQND